MKKYNNNEFSLKDVNKSVELYGFVQKKRNLGGLVFIDLRDRSGIIQLVVRPESKFYDIASSLKVESSIKAIGKITERESKNMKISTGEIEVIVEELEVLNPSIDLPFEISDTTTALEDTRLKYRYLDLRRESLRNNLILRHNVTMSARNYLSKEGFIEVETPILCVPTPEGARDYIVPSRINNGSFYALPQSPQIFKQLLMVGGMEKYFQIARCFRDEDLRADRQPEFTQIDIEMSFAEENDIFAVVEGLMKEIFKNVLHRDLEIPFKRITYRESLSRYGTDKPDTRFDMEISDITEIFKDTTSDMLKAVLNDNGMIGAIVGKNLASEFSRKDIDKLTDHVKIYKAKTLYYLKYEDELTGSIAKALSEKEGKDLIKKVGLEKNDIVFIIGDKPNITKVSLGALRSKIGKEKNLINEDLFNFIWITEFPMYEYSEEEKRYTPAHHPFTSPKKEDIDKMLTDKDNCYSRAYDLALNGYELLSGSVRIHNSELQKKVFEAIDMTMEEAERKFGFFMEAFRYGAPPHCGVGIGLEKLIMILAKTDNIRDVVAFPKTASASDLMNNAPGIVDEKQLKELGIEISKKKE